MKWLTLYTITALVLLFSHSPLFAEPEKLTDDQMTNVKVQQGIKSLDGAETTQEEEDILQSLVSPIPGTELDNTNSEPGSSLTQVELDNLENQINQQNVQEDVSRQLFDQVIQNQNQPQ